VQEEDVTGNPSTGGISNLDLLKDETGYIKTTGEL
jgi:hypothetical protein